MTHFCLMCSAPLQWRTVDGREREICQRCGWIFYEQRKVSAGVRVVQDHRLLLVRRGIDPWYGKWYMPAGFVEVDEEPEKAAEREACEETGFAVQIKELAGVYTYNDDPRGNGVVLIYDAVIRSGDLRISPETLEAGFFTSLEIDQLQLAGDCVRRQVRDWQDLQNHLGKNAHAQI